MDRIVDHLFVFEGQGVIRDFPGNYAEYREEQNEKTIDPEKVKSQIIVNREVEQEVKSTKKKPTFNEKREYDLLEKELKKLNQEKTELSEKLSDSTLVYAQIEKISNRFSEVSKLIDEKEMRWLELSEIV